MSKGKKKEVQPAAEDIDQIQSEVASFASSLGFASSQPSSGFNDVDFRPKTKKASNGKVKQPEEPKQVKKSTPDKKKTNPIKTGDREQKGRPVQKPTPKAPQKTSVADNGVGVSNKPFDRFKNLPKLPLVKASTLGLWYEDAAELEEKIVVGQKGNLDIGNPHEWKGLVEKKRQIGERLLAQYTMDYEASRAHSGDIKMLLATQRSGTAADKVSAYSVLVGDNPLANLRSLDALLGMVTSKVGKRHALSGFEALKELFVQNLLPDRKLKTLLQQPLKLLPETKEGYSLMLFWYWEDCLKQRYERFISGLEEASRDMLPILKDKSLRTIYMLLKSKSEQEQRLLSALVNKLGDPENKAASNADYHLTNLLSEHPNMKGVVISEVDKFLFRPRLAPRAKYHAVNFLSQIRLSHRGDGPKLAKQLIHVYFAVFKVLISELGSDAKAAESGKGNAKKPSSKDEKEKSSPDSHVELDSRLLSAILTGVNRAFPFVSSDEADEIVEVQTPLLFRLVHSKNFNVGIQALLLLDKISSKNQVVSDRFYRSLYSKLLLPSAMNSSKVEMFIGLLLRVMKNDVNLKRVAAFSKRILQVAIQLPPQFTCGCLFLLSEVLKARPPLWNIVLQNELVDEELEHFEDAPDETDDNGRATDEENEPATAKDEEPKSNGIADEDGDPVDRDDSDSSSDEDDKEAPSASSDEDDDADFVVIDEKALQNSKPGQDANQLPKSNSKTRSSLPGGYNIQHREPSYCNADRASWWELTVLGSHAHPSVSNMARTILSGANIVYNGNPLNDLSLTAFLDKFMEKKPKQSAWHGGSQIEPAKKLEMNRHLIGPEILSLAEADVPPEDLVFHRFYANKVNSAAKPKKKKKKKGDDEEGAEDLYGGGDESDNEEIENLLDASEPALDDNEGGYDYDDLDRIDEEDDDEDLIGDASEDEAEPSNIDDMDDDDVSDDEILNIGDMDDGSADDEEGTGDVGGKRKRKLGKFGGKCSRTPFASLEEYEHLMIDDEDEDVGEDDGVEVREKTKKKKKSKSQKKRKLSK